MQNQVRTLDHIIMGDYRYFGLADAGLIEEYTSDFLSFKEGRRA